MLLDFEAYHKRMLSNLERFETFQKIPEPSERPLNAIKLSTIEKGIFLNMIFLEFCAFRLLGF